MSLSYQFSLLAAAQFTSQATSSTVDANQQKLLPNTVNFDSKCNLNPGRQQLSLKHDRNPNRFQLNSTSLFEQNSTANLNGDRSLVSL